VWWATALSVRSHGTLSKNFRMSISSTQSARQQRSRQTPTVSHHFPARKGYAGRATPETPLTSSKRLPEPLTSQQATYIDGRSPGKGRRPA
jgi:hypothetical protein